MARLHPDDIAALARAVARELRQHAGDDGGVPYFIAPPIAAHGGYIYFARCCSSDRLIKIGHARDLAGRRNTLQIGSPYEIAILAYYWHADPKTEEERLHQHFAGAHVRGEWYLPVAGLVETVKAIEHAQANAMTDALRSDR